MIRFIDDKEERKRITRRILEALPEWFEVKESRENYIRESESLPMFACFEDKTSTEAAGFLCLKETGKDTVEIAVMGVLKDHHREGIGRRLLFA